jgi:uncharacterized repeat protein (TIGR03803 family)
MHNKGRFPNVFFGARLRPDSAALAIMVLLLFLIFVFLFLTLTVQPAQGQTYQVIHGFRGRDGFNPYGGLTIDQAGNLYGTTGAGGTAGFGTVFKMSKPHGRWLFTSIYSFQGGNDGKWPFARVIFGPDGSLYGTTYQGGGEGCGYGNGCGTVFKLTPNAALPAAVVGGWTETVLYRFTGGSDGGTPMTGGLVFDQQGSIYGTTVIGGTYGAGTVYKLTPFGGGWTESVIYSFTGGSDGQWPFSGVIFDQAGNLYGTTGDGGSSGYGTVFELSPSASGWIENVLYDFPGGSLGGGPMGGLTFDASGNLWGTTTGYGSVAGTFFVLRPSLVGWQMSPIGDLFGPGFDSWGPGPAASLGSTPWWYGDNYYGTTYASGQYGYGSVFAFSVECGVYTLHDFGWDDGYPVSNLVSDGYNLFGTASGGDGPGEVFEIIGGVSSCEVQSDRHR